MMLNEIFFEQKIEKLLPDIKEKIAVAVSGGADSLCLTLCLNSFCKKNGIKLLALTIDHKIRKESTAEAKKVHSFLKKQKTLSKSLLL